MDFAVKNFFDSGFLDRINTKDDAGLLAAQNRSMQENSIAAGCLVRLGFYTDNIRYKEIAQEILSIFASQYKKYGVHAASYALAVEKFIDPIEITAKSKEFVEDMPHDPRVMVKFDENSPKNIVICLGNKCLRFDNLEEAKRLLVIR